MWTVAQGCSSPVPPDITASDPLLTQNNDGFGGLHRVAVKQLAVQLVLQRRGVFLQDPVDLLVVAVEFLHQNAIRPRPAGERFDPRRDPRTEKPGRKQWNGEYLRVMKTRDNPALFSQNPAEDGPIESSHA